MANFQTRVLLMGYKCYTARRSPNGDTLTTILDTAMGTSTKVYRCQIRKLGSDTQTLPSPTN
jgi:hypothetical protein